MMENKTITRSSICLIVCYFGKLPPYIDCVFRSCALNSDIDWLIFTDDHTPYTLPPNVYLHKTTLVELKKIFSTKLGFDAKLLHSRNLCNFKVAFGFFFQEKIEKYDFWGHCDLDMIFGDLRKFLTETILADYDKILCRGHLTLYRNDEQVNRYFMLDCPGVADYRARFSDPDSSHLQFDEWQGINLIFRYHNLRQFHDEFIVDVIPPTRWKTTRFEGTAIKNYPDQVFYWHKGKFFHAHYNVDQGIDDDEYAYIHFQKRFMPAPAFDPRQANGFFITPDGFFPYDREPLTNEDFVRYNRGHLRSTKQLLQIFCHAALRKLNLISKDK